MIKTIYIEDQVKNHPRVKKICRQFSGATQITCDRYGEVFNPKAQNFRLQKQNSALILAQKHSHFVLPAPNNYNIGASANYYFSHMLNCVYDCRYCFLQGMYQSANYVVFVNYEDYFQEIRALCLKHSDETVHFFSGYDGDSLAFEPVTRFAEYFLEKFADVSNAWLELRTKSTQIRGLLNKPVMSRGIVAFSLTPDQIARKLEHKAPTLERRLQALRKLQDKGWRIGLRFDPLLYQHNYQQQYRQLFEQTFEQIDSVLLHSVSLGVFRLPEKYFKKMHKLYPEEKLFAAPLQNRNGMTSYCHDLEQEMMAFCREQLLQFVPQEKFFPCQ